MYRASFLQLGWPPGSPDVANESFFAVALALSSGPAKEEEACFWAQRNWLGLGFGD